MLFGLYTYLCIPRMLVLLLGSRRHQMPLKLALYTVVSHLVWHWEPSLGPLEEQQGLLIRHFKCADFCNFTQRFEFSSMTVHPCALVGMEQLTG